MYMNLSNSIIKSHIGIFNRHINFVNSQQATNLTGKYNFLSNFKIEEYIEICGKSRKKADINCYFSTGSKILQCILFSILVLQFW